MSDGEVFRNLRKPMDAPYELRKREYGDLMRLYNSRQEDRVRQLKLKYKPEPIVSKNKMRKALQYLMYGLLAVGFVQQLL